MTIRSFIAVDPSPEVSHRIAETISRLSNQTRGFRWVGPEGIHLTLRFLGDVEESDLEKISQELEQLAKGVGPISLAAQGIGFFPRPERPRVVWVGLQGEIEKLSSFQRKVAEAVEDLPVHPEEKRDFVPHLTIARVRDADRCGGIGRVLQLGKDADFGSFVIDSVILYKSRLTPQGAEYSKLGEFKFAL